VDLIPPLGDLLRSVGADLLAWRSSGGTNGAWEGPQFHARADRWAHQRIVAGLAQLAPGVPIVSEEDSPEVSAVDAERYWLIDPIDGTASYAHGFPGYVTQIALMERQSPVLAVVFAPETSELFVAEKDGGAFRNGARLHCSASTSSLTLIDNEPQPRASAARLYEELSFTGYVESGSIGLKICRVADGTADALFKDCPVRDWDVAAPQLILEEAGGCVVDAMGRPFLYGPPRRQHGVLAARHIALAQRIASWHASRTATP